MKIHLLLRHNLAGKFLNHFIVFLINVQIVRMLGPERSGDFFNELYILNFISFGFSLGLDFSVVRLMAQEPALGSRLKKMLVALTVVFLLLASLCVPLISPLQDVIKQPVSAIILFCTGNLMLILFQGLLSAQKKFNTQNLILAISNLLFLFWLYTNSGEVGRGISRIAVAYGILFFIQGCTMLLFSKTGKETVRASISWPVFLRSGSLIMLSSLVYFAFLRIDNFFVEAYCDAGTLGNYVQCGKVGQYFLYFSSAVSSTLLPFMRREGLAHSYVQWRALLKPYVLLLLAAALTLALTGPWLFPFVFGSGFEDMHLYMWIFLPGYLCLGLLTLMNAVYIGKGNIKAIFRGDLAGLLFVGILDYFLVPLWGARGAALISSAAYILLFLNLWTGLRRQFTLPARDESVSYL